MDNLNNSIQASSEVTEPDEMPSSKSVLNVSFLPESNLEQNNEKDGNRRLTNIKKISKFWKTVKNKKLNSLQDSRIHQCNGTMVDNPDSGVSLQESKLNEQKSLVTWQSTEDSSFSNSEDNPACRAPLFSSDANVKKSHCEVTGKKCQPCVGTIHTQVDYIHCLVPDLLQITNCNYYWGIMDRFEAEKILESRAEGTFLLRDSAQEEFLFSVSFRRYSRSLHARIEQWDHKFSFDSHDSSVFAARSVCDLIEHYKDPSCCMFFEPMLTIPLPRVEPFSLQHLCRANICATINYDDISFLPIPKSLKQYLQYYHYKQKVRVRQF